MDRRGCRQESAWTQTLQGTQEIERVGENRLKTERLEGEKDKKRGKDLENGTDQDEKEEIGAKIRAEGGSAFLKNRCVKERLRRKMNGNRCEESQGQVRR